MSDIDLIPCPFCGALVSMCRGNGAYRDGYAFCHHDGTRANGFGGETSSAHRCVVRRNIVFANYSEAKEWADAWNRRVT